MRWASGVPLIVCRHGRPGWLQASAHNPSRPLPAVATVWYWINKLRDRQPSGRPRLAARLRRYSRNPQLIAGRLRLHDRAKILVFQGLSAALQGPDPALAAGLAGGLLQE